MRYIPTSAARVEELRKQAKKLQRSAGGKHADCLNKAAQRAGYAHWHHVIRCADQLSHRSAVELLRSSCEAVIDAAVAGRAVMLSRDEAIGSVPMLTFSTADGDAWLLDADNQGAICLCWHGQARPPVIRELTSSVEIEWDGSFELRGPFFEVQTDDKEIGHRAIGGYPVEALRAWLNDFMPVEQKIDQVILQSDAVAITPDIEARLGQKGWPLDEVRLLASQGARYSPSRDSMLMPPVSSDDDSEEEASTAG